MALVVSQGSGGRLLITLYSYSSCHLCNKRIKKKTLYVHTGSQKKKLRRRVKGRGAEEKEKKRRALVVGSLWGVGIVDAADKSGVYD